MMAIISEPTPSAPTNTIGSAKRSEANHREFERRIAARRSTRALAVGFVCGDEGDRVDEHRRRIVSQ
jgi:hypothetical protein